MPSTPSRVGAGSSRPRADAAFAAPEPAAAPVARPARFEDAARLASDLRPADLQELAALRSDPLAALLEAIEHSREAYAVTEGPQGALIALFGVAPLPEAPAIGAPWMMASPRLERVARPFLRRCRGWVGHLGREFLMLTNAVDARNALHIAWLRWCGFTFLRRFPAGPDGLPFLEFVRLSPCDPASSPSNGDLSMCNFATAIAASSLASAGSSLWQSNQQHKAAKRAAKREEERLRRLTLNRYERIAQGAAGSRREASERIRASREEALRVSEAERTRREERGGAGRSLAATMRDIGGAAARDEEQARFDDVRRQQELSLSGTTNELQMLGRLEAVSQPTRNLSKTFGTIGGAFGAARDLKGGLERL